MRTPLGLRAAAALFVLAAGTAGVATADESLTLTVRSTDGEPIDGSVAVVVECASKTHTTTVDLGEGTATVRLHAEGGWPCRVRAKLSGYWSPTLVVPRPASEPVPLSLWRAGTLQAELQLAEDAAAHSKAELPEQIRFRLLERTDPSVADRGVMLEGTCRIADRALHECAAPVGQWHLRLSTEGFTPIYRWNVQIPTDQPLDLDRLTLRTGGSVAGRVVTEDGAADPKTVQVTIRPVGDNPWRRNEKKLVTTHAEVSRHGYFQLTGLHRGAFILTAQQPGYVATTIRPLRVGLGELVELEEPVVLERAVRLHVEVTPQSPPDSDGWHVQLLTPSAASAAAHGRTVGGLWASDGIARGSYRLVVSGDAMGIVAEQKIELAHDRQLVRIDLDLVQVHGQVLLGEDPVAEAEVTFANAEPSGRHSARRSQTHCGSSSGISWPALGWPTTRAPRSAASRSEQRGLTIRSPSLSITSSGCVSVGGAVQKAAAISWRATAAARTGLLRAISTRSARSSLRRAPRSIRVDSWNVSSSRRSSRRATAIRTISGSTRGRSRSNHTPLRRSELLMTTATARSSAYRDAHSRATMPPREIPSTPQRPCSQSPSPSQRERTSSAVAATLHGARCSR